MQKTALLLIDIQNDYFNGGLWPVDEMAPAAQNAAKLLAHARAQGQLVIHIRHEIPSPDAPFFRPDSEGANIHQSVAPQKGETVILKHIANSFQDTSLRTTLQSAEITALTICGAMSQMCIDATTRAAKDFGYDVTIAHDACAAKAVSFNGVEVPAEQVHAAFMGALVGSYAKVVATADIL